MEVTPALEGPAAVRPASPSDVEAIALVWRTGWRDAHLGRVPASLLAHRHVGSLRHHVRDRLDTTALATVGSRLAGFVMTHRDEIEQLYVARDFRGTGVAATLLAHGETVIGATHALAWLAVVDGNARARRFYERHDWRDAGPFDNPAWTTGDTTIPVPSRRYVKSLTGVTTQTTPDRWTRRRTRAYVPRPPDRIHHEHSLDEETL